MAKKKVKEILGTVIKDIRNDAFSDAGKTLGKIVEGKVANKIKAKKDELFPKVVKKD